MEEDKDSIGKALNVAPFEKTFNTVEALKSKAHDEFQHVQFCHILYQVSDGRDHYLKPGSSGHDQVRTYV